jgi:hypothetical protein
MLRELWSDPLVEVERMRVPQSRAKQGTRRLSEPCKPETTSTRNPVKRREIPSANNRGHTRRARPARESGTNNEVRIGDIFVESEPKTEFLANRARPGRVHWLAVRAPITLAVRIEAVLHLQMHLPPSGFPQGLASP